VLCTVPFAWMWMFPDELASAATSLVGMALFASNLVFWQESGYFATATEFKPFLHTWSLAVEEQFYLIFPLLLLLIARVMPRWRSRVLWVGFASSLALAQWGAIHHASASYYLLPTRAWELLMGALLVLTPPPSESPGRSRYAQIGSITGIALIAYAIIAYDRNTPFPGIYALAPTVGTALVIYFAVAGTIVFQVLSSPPFVGIGLISYSAYLWHQPIFALARYKTLTPPPVGGALLLSLLSLAIAYLSWRWIEIPFRYSARFTRRQIFAFAAATSFIMGGLGLVGRAERGFPHRFSLLESLSPSFRRSPRAATCFDLPRIHERADWLCDLGASNDSTTFMVTGDSHALSFLDTFDAIARTTGTHGVLVGISGCPPLLRVYLLRPDQSVQDCHRLNQRVFEYVRDHHIRTVFLLSRWTYYTDGGYDGANVAYLGLSENSRPTTQLSRDAFDTGVDETFSAYTSLGVRLVVVLQVPEQLYEPRHVYFRLFDGDSSNARARIRALSVPIAEHHRLQDYTRTRLAASAARHRGVLVVNLDPAYCDTAFCVIGDEFNSRYYNRDHLSLEGAQLALSSLRDALGTSAPEPAPDKTRAPTTSRVP
jgi:peptidoglycan/LPS O-acetylase OafA/YrhL